MTMTLRTPNMIDITTIVWPCESDMLAAVFSYWHNACKLRWKRDIERARAQYSIMAEKRPRLAVGSVAV